MEFEYDVRKSEANKAKHGIDFEEAQELWKDPNYLEFPLTADDETRVMVIGKITGRSWSGVITHRGEKIRIISVRRSRTKEINAYESTYN